MTLAEEGNRLRLEILRLGDPRKRQYPEELRAKILDWVERSKLDGTNEDSCAETLDVPRQRFSSWRSWRRSVRTQKALVPVEIRDEGKPFGPLAFVAPSGHRIEGLTIGEAIALLRAFA